MGLDILRLLLRRERCKLWDTTYVTFVKDSGRNIDIDKEINFLDDIDAQTCTFLPIYF